MRDWRGSLVCPFSFLVFIATILDVALYSSNHGANTFVAIFKDFLLPGLCIMRWTCNKPCTFGDFLFRNAQNLRSNSFLYARCELHSANSRILRSPERS